MRRELQGVNRATAMLSLDRDALTRDYFALFGLERRQRLDSGELERLYQEMQNQVHPDKHAHQGEAERRLAMQWASRTNEAYLTLRSPLKRAEYLLRLVGYDPQIERNTAMPLDFLMAQMEWRETVATARAAGEVETLDRLYRDLRQALVSAYDRLAETLDQQKNYGVAGDLVRQLMFQEKLLQEIDDALAAAEA